MKKIFSVLAAVLMAATMSVNATPQRGKFIHVDTSVNKNLKPQIAFCQDRVEGADVTTLQVWTVNTNNFNEFTAASRVLIRFADGAAVRLNRVGEGVEKNKHTDKKGTSTITYFRTITTYEVTPEVIEKLEAGIGIVKIRVVFKENDAKDYDIAEGYQLRISADLLKSYQEAVQLNRKANSDLSDEDF